MRTIKEIIVHCSATPEGRPHTVQDIRRWHKERGFKDIGYHYVIYLDGSIHEGRSVKLTGAHCTGHNKNSIGVCYIGGMTADMKHAKDTRTDAQKKALRLLLKHLKQQHPQARIFGHRDFAAKACPSFDARREYADI